MDLQVGVKAFLKKEGKFLLGRRSSLKYPEVGAKWDILGGRIDPGTSLLDNLKREIKEETGLEFKGEPVLIAAQDILRIPGKHTVRLSYVVDIEGEPVLSDEHEEFGWFTLNEIRQLDPLDIYVAEIVKNDLKSL